tara:strand:- start:1097 stop:2707 length:1611 start_codon:yes stop_codon:yes gene_type:complete
MGSTNFKITKLALAMGVTLGLSGCFSDNDNNVEIKPPVVEPPTTVKVPVSDTKEALNFFVNATVVDASTSDLTVVENVTVKFFENGVASTNIVDVDGNEIAAAGITSETGSFTFNVKEDAEISEVTLIVSAADYFNKSTVVDFGEKDAVIETLVSLAKKADLVTAEKKVAASAGKLAEALETGTEDGSVGVAVSTDVELQDAEGNPISGEEVTVSVVTAPLSAEDGKASAADIIPAGFQTVTNDDVTKVAVPEAYFEVNMSAGETAIKKFGAPITLTTSVKGDYTQGDTLTVTSFNEDTGVWTKEATPATIGAANELVFPASFDVDHLTGFLLSTTADSCDKPATYKLVGADVPAAGLFLGVEGLGFYEIKSQSGVIIPQAKLKSKGVTPTKEYAIALVDRNGTPWTQPFISSVCGEFEISAVAPEETLVDVALPMSFSCSNAEVNDQLALGGAVVTYRQAGKASQIAFQSATKGTYNLNSLVSGKEYTVTVNTRIEGFTVEPFTITAGETVAPQNFVRSNCVVEDKEVTGTGSGS